MRKHLLALIVLSLCLCSAETIAADKDEYKSQIEAPLHNNDQVHEDAYRILFIGDSITRHGTSERLDWNHVAGMAASSEANDYVHRLADKIQTTLPNKQVDIYIHTGGGSGKARQRYEAIGEVLPVRPHLIVIQLGEHEKQEDGAEQLFADYEKLVTAFDQQTNPKPLIIATGNWSLSKPIVHQDGTRSYSGWAATIEATMQAVCEKHDIPFVSVSEIAMDPRAHGSGTHKGVKWHPNDKGHAGYADRIFEAYQDAQIK